MTRRLLLTALLLLGGCGSTDHWTTIRTDARAMAIRQRTRRRIITAISGLLFAGCGVGSKHYWVRPDATTAEFQLDSYKCARVAPTEADYNRCMRDRGYVREDHTSGPLHGFRSFVDTGDGSDAWTNYPKSLDQQDFARANYECQRSATVYGSYSFTNVNPTTGSVTTQGTVTSQGAYSSSSTVRIDPSTATTYTVPTRQVDKGLLAACMGAHAYRFIEGYDARRIRYLRQIETEK
jgi:hypothetical protein